MPFLNGDGTKAMVVPSRSSLLVRVGGRSCSGLLLGWQDASEPPEGLFVLVPGLVLGADLAAGLEGLKDTKGMTAALVERTPNISVVMRRGMIKPRLTSISAGAVMVVEKSRADDLAELPAVLVAAWRWPELAAKLPSLLAEFKVSGLGFTAEDARELRDLLSIFLVLQLQPVPDEAASLADTLRRALDKVAAVPPRGHPVCTSSAPLGAPALLGAVCRGVVSGTAPGGLFTLTDARVSPGSEGAGVYALARGEDGTPVYEAPCAVVFSPLTWWRGEAVGFTLCLGLRRLLAAALRDLQRRVPVKAIAKAPAPAADNNEGLDLYGIDKSVVMVRCAHMWGSGFMVDKRNRVVLTCAHVIVKEAGDPTVCWGRNSVSASVLWRSADGVPYDIAILQLADDPCVDELEPLALDTREPCVGEEVHAVGFPLFPEKPGRFLRPLVSRGEVCGWWPSASSQILTTCCVQSGASGGPLLRVNRADDGHHWLSVIGLLVCNAQLGTGRDAVVFPHVNFALWTNAVVEPINAYLNSGDKRHLEELQCKSAAIRRQWKLQPPLMCKL